MACLIIFSFDVFFGKILLKIMSKLKMSVLDQLINKVIGKGKFQIVTIVVVSTVMLSTGMMMTSSVFQGAIFSSNLI